MVADAPHVFDMEITTFTAQTPHPMVSTDVALAQSPVFRMASIVDVGHRDLGGEFIGLRLSLEDSERLLAVLDFHHLKVPGVQAGDIEEARTVTEAGGLGRGGPVIDGEGHVPRDKGRESGHHALRW
jgi:hypothetical protein